MYLYSVSPDTIEYIAIGEYPDVHVGHEDVVEPSLLLVPEKGVGHPHLLGVCHRQVLDATWAEERVRVKVRMLRKGQS